jgi:hypothetical protein
MARVGMVPCPHCSHVNSVPEYLLQRGGETSCGKCGSKMTIIRHKPDPGKSITLKLTTASGSITFDVFIRADGIWQFGNEIERAVVEAIDQDSDRASAVMAGSMVENRLKTALLSRCTHVPKLETRHFHSSGAMGSFSIKIDIAYMMQIISAAAYNDLVIIKDIRNAFAHRTDIKDFQTQWLRDKTKNLKLIETQVGEHKAGKSAPVFKMDERFIYVNGFNARRHEPRDRYMITAQLLMLCLAPGKLPDYSIPLI